VRLVGERPHIRAAVERTENPNNERFGGRLGERVRVKEEDTGDFGGR